MEPPPILPFIVILLLTNANFCVSCPSTCICNDYEAKCVGSQLQTLPDGIDPIVTALDLSRNNFRSFPIQLQHFLHLLTLNLSSNHLSTLPNNVILPPSLTVLDLSHNKFKDWTDIKFNIFLTSNLLSYLDFSNNPLRNIPVSKPFHIRSLTTLALNNCSMDIINGSVFTGLTNLTTLELDGNNFEEITTEMSSPTLKHLSISNTLVKHIAKYAFSKLTALETLTLKDNYHLSEIEIVSETLQYLDLTNSRLKTPPKGMMMRVKEVNLYGNSIDTIMNYSFQSVLNVEMLNLSFNSISRIEGSAFYGLVALKYLYICTNKLVYIGPKFFATNINLLQLHLSHNYIQQIENLQSSSLETLDLSYCEIYKIDKNFLAHIPSLRHLILSHNLIDQIPVNFSGGRLEYLDISSCRIRSITNTTFINMPFLRYLNLTNNSLTTISPTYFPQVLEVIISGNPWRCECKQLRDMYIFLYNSGFKTYEPMCDSPEKVAGKTWAEACLAEWNADPKRDDNLWWYSVIIVCILLIVFVSVMIARKLHKMKEKRLREVEAQRRAEDRERLRRMQLLEREHLETENRNAPDPREVQGPPSYNDALLLPKLDASHPSLAGSMHSLASINSLHASNPEISKRSRSRTKRRRRRRRSSSGGGTPRASQVLPTESESEGTNQEQTRVALESDF